MSSDVLWVPDAGRRTELADFASWLKLRSGFDWGGDYEALWAYSVEHPEVFWSQLWDWHGIIGDKGDVVLAPPQGMPPQGMYGGQFFPEGRLNYAENMLAEADARPALIAHVEGAEAGDRRCLTRAEVKAQVLAMAGWMQAQGVVAGDRVAAYTPNIPEAVVAMLAAASLGAIFSSCSSDFGFNGVKDRFGQIAPKIVLAADGYRYGGKAFERLDIIRRLAAAVPSIETVIIVPFLDESLEREAVGVEGAVLFEETLTAPPLKDFIRLPFNHPLYILYSSGTTGAPKCITHGAGGTLIQHIKEHRLHGDIRPQEPIFYFTTCGWMMWNWLVAGLAVKAVVVLYEGNPFYPGPQVLWQMAAEDRVVMFGTSAKYIDAVRKSGYRPGEAVDLGCLRQICSTGSPLSSDGFAFIYDAVKSDVHLASVSGGTDLISCFVLGCPVKPVHAGEIQARGLGMAVDVWDDEGRPLRGAQGELVCTKPFPSMPVGFWGDDGGEAYRAAYFEHGPERFKGIWRHGDWATLTDRGSVIIHGRSDATLNPGGVRIGTAEIYRQVEAFAEVAEALVVGQRVEEAGAVDVRVVLFVKMASGCVLDDALVVRLKAAIREGATPRHVPEVVLEVGDIPRTRSGKITELAVRDIIEGREVKNVEALANPEALAHFRNRPELL